MWTICLISPLTVQWLGFNVRPPITSSMPRPLCHQTTPANTSNILLQVAQSDHTHTHTHYVYSTLSETDWTYAAICARRWSKSFSFLSYSSWPTQGSADSTMYTNQSERACNSDHKNRRRRHWNHCEDKNEHATICRLYYIHLRTQPTEIVNGVCWVATF